MDATVAPPSKQSEISVRLDASVSAWWGLIVAFSVLLLVLASAGKPDEALQITGVAAAAALTIAFGLKLRQISGSNAIYGSAIVLALAASAAFEVGAAWLHYKHSPWPPPSWLMGALLVASLGWLAAATSRLPARGLVLPLIDALLPGSMLAFAALYSVPQPAWSSIGHDRFLWIVSGTALALAFAASSMTPASVGILCATLGAGGVLLGSLGGTTLAAVIGNTAFAAAGCTFFAPRPPPNEELPRAPRLLNRADLLLAPALVLLTFVAILLHDAEVEERQLALRLCAGAALALLVVRQVALIWSQREALSVLDTAHRDLSERASLDALTRLPNRDALLARMNEEFERARRHDQPLSLCFVDIDFFKSVNDRFGHPAGDESLRVVAATLRRTARSIDFVGRYGGEEFLIVAPGTQLSEAVILGERLRVAVAGVSGPVEASQPIRLTISVGVAEYPANASSLDQLIEQADAALYVSKRSGRNRVTASEVVAAD